VGFWDDEAFQPKVSEFVKFDAVGDSVSGRIVAIEKKEWPDGKVDPQLVLETADGRRTVTIGPVDLKAKVVAARPEVGDVVKRMEFVGSEPRGGGKTKKLFAVEIAKGAQPKAASDLPF